MSRPRQNYNPAPIFFALFHVRPIPQHLFKYSLHEATADGPRRCLLASLPGRLELTTIGRLQRHRLLVLPHNDLGALLLATVRCGARRWTPAACEAEHLTAAALRSWSPNCHQRHAELVATMSDSDWDRADAAGRRRWTPA
jgi:hypothetical protein